MSTDCLSVGLLVADHLCAPIARLPKSGELVLTDHLLLNIGGCASNAAMDLARLGVNVGIIGCVGKDAFGRFILETLRERGIDTSNVQELTDVGTSGTLIVNVAGEDRRFIHTMGANARVTAQQIDMQRVRETKVLYIGGYLLMAGLQQDGLIEVFREARAAGVKTVLDVVLPGPGDHWSQLEKLLAFTDVFLPNNDEAAIITGLDNPQDQAQKFFDAGAGTAVVTCGGAGTVLVTAGSRFHAASYPVTHVGSTGAGDAFDAGYIAGLLAGLDPLGCVKWGSALGASCVRSLGATESVFTRPEAEAFIRDNRMEVQAW